MKFDIIVPQFGEMSIPEAAEGTATYRALNQPILQGGISLKTYVSDGFPLSLEMPSRSMGTSMARVDKVGHVIQCDLLG